VPLTEIEPRRAEPEIEQRAEPEEADWEHNGQGEAPDNSALHALHVAYRVVAKFPELTRRYQKFIGATAVISSALIVLASIAVSRRLHQGESVDKILAEITPDEIVNASKVKPSKPEKKDKANSRPSH
jgi:hypothetical protein